MGKQFLFPTDFSVCAEHAFSHAAHLAARYEARLHIMSVVDNDKEAEGSPINYLPLEADELASELAIQRDAGEGGPDLSPEGLETVNVTLTGPSPWRVILDYAEQHDIDLIVMGTHGRHGVDRMIMGSVAEQVVRRSKCPVLTIRASESGEGGKGPVFVPVDFSTFAKGTIAQALELAAAYESGLHLVHVVEPIALPSVYGVDPSGVMVPDMEERAEKALGELAADTIPDSVPYRTEVLVGHAAHEIVQSAGDVAARMIVIATHGLTGFKRLLMGSVTEQVVRDAPCPVFTVRSFGKQLSEAVQAAMEAETPETD